MCRRKLFFGTVALLALVGLTATTVMGQARKRTYRATAMVTVVQQTSARGVHGAVDQTLHDYESWIRPFERLFKRDEVLERALASAPLALLKLDFDSVRDALVVEHSPGTEWIRIHFDGPDRAQNVAIVRQIISAYIEVCEEKGWANLKRPSAGSWQDIRVQPTDPSQAKDTDVSTSANQVPDPSIATAERLASAVQSRDQIELERAGMFAQLEALRVNGVSSVAQKLIIEERRAELSALNAQLRFLNHRIDGLKTATNATAIDSPMRKHSKSTTEIRIPAWIRIIERGD